MLTVNFDIFKIKAGELVLDAGCGEGRHTLTSCKSNCSVYALDLSYKDLSKVKYTLNLMRAKKEVRGSVSLLRGDVKGLPFKDNSFHKIICCEVLEHLREDRKGIKELVRVLKPGGELAVSVPTYLTEAIFWKLSDQYHHNPGGHIRKYKAKELIAKLRAFNLRIYAIRYEHAFHSVYWLLKCIFGVKNEKALLPSLYHRFFLVPSIFSERMKSIERIFNLFFPKSLVVYTKKREGVRS